MPLDVASHNTITLETSLHNWLPAAVLSPVIVTVLFAAKVVNLPNDLVELPIGTASIDPPVMTALLDRKLFAVTTPLIPTVSVDEPILTVSGVELSVAILTVLPELRVPILIAPFVNVPVPAFIVTVPPEELAALVSAPRIFTLPPVGAATEFAGLIVSPVPPVKVVISGLLSPAREITPDSEILTVDAPPDCRSKYVPDPPFVSFITNAVALP